MERFGRFFAAMQQDFKAFFYWCMVFTLFRCVFIVLFSSQLTEQSTGEIADALWLGFRLSLKTAGYITVLGAIMATLPQVVLSKWPGAKIRRCWHCFCLIIFTVLFFARIPFYQIFNSGFNMMLVNGMHDDKYAILMTAIEQYQLFWRLPCAILAGLFLYWGMKYCWRHTPAFAWQKVRLPKISAVCTVIFICLFSIFVRYGGAIGYAASINWENAARLHSNLLNEAVLDDGQALYRVYSMHRELKKAANIALTADELRQKILLAGGNPDSATIDEAFLRRVEQPKLKTPPRQVAVIVGESFGIWPLLPQFQNLGLAENALRLQNSGAAPEVMLAHGSGTIAAVNGLVAGLPEAGLYENYQENSLKNQYHTGIGYIMRQLGYKTVFWYGGFSGWQNIKNFVLAQSFDEFHCANEFTYQGGNAWGCPDQVLFEYIAQYMQKHSREKICHVILTTSNHPPYTIDVDKEGFARVKVQSNLPPDIKNSPAALTELGHIWYADQAVGRFVSQAEKIVPDALFVITGDHSERFTFAKEEEIRTLSAIPCIFYGAGIKNSRLSIMRSGCTMQIAGTLAEFVAPSGFTYTAILPNMFHNSGMVFNHNLYVQNGVLTPLIKAPQKVKEQIDAARSVAAWRILKGNEI